MQPPTSPLDRFTRYANTVSGGIDGWVDARIWILVAVLHRLQSEVGVTGPTAEIGVHHGKFLLGIEQLTAPRETVVAIDLFAAQHLNADGSGAGDRAAFENHVRRFASFPERVITWEADSLSVSPLDLLRLGGERRFSCISIDGGHTSRHTVGDLRLAEKVLGPGGVVYIDDYCNPDWPGVNEGVIRYLRSGGSLVPLVSYANKLVVCSLSWHQLLAANLGGAAAALGKQIKAKQVALDGHAFLNVHAVADH